MNVPLSPFAPESLVSRDGFGGPVPREPAHLHTQAEDSHKARARDKRKASSYYTPGMDLQNLTLK